MRIVEIIILLHSTKHSLEVHYTGTAYYETPTINRPRLYGITIIVNNRDNSPFELNKISTIIIIDYALLLHNYNHYKSQQLTPRIDSRNIINHSRPILANLSDDEIHRVTRFSRAVVDELYELANCCTILNTKLGVQKHSL